jgi:hypothetical protein
LTLLLLSFGPDSFAQDEPSAATVRAKGHAALLSGRGQGSVLDVSWGPGLEGGARFPTARRGQFGVFGFVEQDSWLAVEVEGRVDPGTLSFGLGGEWLYFGLLRTALRVGPSVLLFDTALHRAGNVGIFVGLEPLGIVFELDDAWALCFDPLSIAWVNPTPEGGLSPSVGHLQYRSSLGVEWRPGFFRRP